MRPAALLAPLAIALASCGGGVGTIPLLAVGAVEDPAALELSTVCSENLGALVIEAETEIVVTLSGDRVNDNCESQLVVVLDAPAGNRFVRDGANGTVFGWDGREYLQVAPAP